MTESQTYAPNEWVVHRNYGVGQIKSTEQRSIGGKENTYCKIQTFNSTLWLPLAMTNDEWLRKLAPPVEIKQALEILESHPKSMADNLNIRKNQIKEVDSNDAPVVIAVLLRDLWSLKKDKKTLSQIEEAALRHFTDCFLSEWSVSMGITMDEAKVAFKGLINKSQEKLKATKEANKEANKK